MTYNQHFKNTSTLNSGFTKKTTKWCSTCEGLQRGFGGELWTSKGRCRLQYFKNKGILRIKAENYSFWMKFAQFIVLIGDKLFVRAWSVMCFLLDNIAA